MIVRFWHFVGNPTSPVYDRFWTQRAELKP